MKSFAPLFRKHSLLRLQNALNQEHEKADTPRPKSPAGDLFEFYSGLQRAEQANAPANTVADRPDIPGTTALSSANMTYLIGISLFINLLMLTSPLYMLQIYDRVVSSGSIDTLIFLSLACCGLLLANGLLEGFRSQLTNNLASEYQMSWAPRILKCLAQKNTSGQQKQEPLQDLDTVQRFLSGNTLIAFLDAPWTPVFLIVLFVLHPLLGLTAVAGAVILTVLAIITELTTRKLYLHAHTTTAQSSNRAAGILKNADVVRSMGMFGNLQAGWLKSYNRGAALHAQANDRAAFLRGLTKFFRPLLQMGILGFGALLVIQGDLTAGSMVAGSILMGRALAPIEQVVGGWRTILQTRGAWQRLKGFIDENVKEEDRQMEHPAAKGRLQVDNVTAYVPGTKTPVLQKIEFALEPGEALAIVGPSGAGKSTLARIIAGALEPDVGCSRLDGIEMAHWSNEQRGQNIGYLPQDVQLFEGTVAQNISRFEDGPDQSVHAAAQLATVSELVNRLPDGFMTELQPGGQPLSPGQCQRVALARALYGNPRLVVLDEPNAHLDSEGEEALVEAINTLKSQGVTVVLITHRSALLNQMDKVLALASGRVRVFDEKTNFFNKLAAVA